MKKGLACDQRVYSPEFEVAKDMKFVAHDPTIAHFYMSNFNLFLETLDHIIDHSDKDDMVAEARGHMKHLRKKVSKASLDSSEKFFRGAIVYEILLQKALACDKRV